MAFRKRVIVGHERLCLIKMVGRNQCMIANLNLLELLPKSIEHNFFAALI
jgi:hypothetical protein